MYENYAGLSGDDSDEDKTIDRERDVDGNRGDGSGGDKGDNSATS